MNNLVNIIKKANTIAILGHDSEDADSVGSCYAAKFALLGLGKDVECYFSDVPEKRLAFLGQNYVLFDEENVPEVDLCICIDCADALRIGKRKAIFDAAKHTACIDHHKTNAGFAEINYIDSKAPAAGEIIYELLCEMGIKLTEKIAENLYAAISSDTGSFKYSNVRPRTMEIIGELLKIGIDHAWIARCLFDTEPLNVIKFKGEIINGIEQYLNGKLNVVTATKDLLLKYSLEEKDSGDIVNIARGVEGCEIAVSIRETDEKIKISFRSNGKYGVSAIAEHFGGGGHIMAAGASQTGKTIDEVKKEVIKVCEDVLNG